MMNNVQKAIVVSRLNAEIDGTSILHDISLSIPRAAWTSIVGPNGAGKSSLLKVLAGLLRYRGSVHVFDQCVSTLSRQQRARSLSWLGQNQAAPEDLGVHNIVMLGRLPHQAWLAGPNERDYSVVEQALRLTHAWEWRERRFGQLSGGERQRVLLARALAVEAEILLMDEPLANLDPPHQADWMRTVKHIVAQGKTVVSVLHEISFALQADYLMIMQQGRLKHYGPSDQVSSHQALCAVFEQRLAIHQVDRQWIALPV